MQALPHLVSAAVGVQAGLSNPSSPASSSPFLLAVPQRPLCQQPVLWGSTHQSRLGGRSPPLVLSWARTWGCGSSQLSVLALSRRAAITSVQGHGGQSVKPGRPPMTAAFVPLGPFLTVPAQLPAPTGRVRSPGSAPGHGGAGPTCRVTGKVTSSEHPGVSSPTSSVPTAASGLRQVALR